jgi:hypothetical protein
LSGAIRRIPGRFALREQAGVHQVYRVGPQIDSMDYLRSHYAPERAAP